MTTLTDTDSRRSLFFAWFRTNLIAAGISLLFLAGAGFLIVIGIVYAAMGGNPLGYVLLIAALPVGAAGVAWLGAAQAQALGFSRRIGGLLMLAAVFAGYVALRVVLTEFFSANRASGFNSREAWIVSVAPGIGGLVLGLCQARLAPWLQRRTLHWTLATGLGWFLSALAFSGANIALSNSNNVDVFQSFGMAGAAMVVTIIVTGLAYAFLRSAAPVQPDPASAASAPPA